LKEFIVPKNWSIDKGDYYPMVDEYLKLEKVAKRKKKLQLIMRLLLISLFIVLITIFII